MTVVERPTLADQTATTLAGILHRIECRDLAATPAMQARLQGAVVALEAFAGDDPAADLRAMLPALRRPARNTKTLCHIWDDVADVDTTTPAGDVAAALVAVFAQLEGVPGERTGHTPGRRLGRPSQVPADVVARIIAQRTSGAGFRRIANGLNRDGVPTAHGGAQWYASTVQRVFDGQDVTTSDQH